MAHKGPSVPNQPRTLRSRSLEIGTVAAGFDGSDSIGYSAQAGHPVTVEHPEQVYVGKAPNVTDRGAKPIQFNPIKQ